MTEARKQKLKDYKRKYWIRLVLRPGLIKMSQTTPFNLDDLKEAGNRIRSFGVNK